MIMKKKYSKPELGRVNDDFESAYMAQGSNNQLGWAGHPSCLVGNKFDGIPCTKTGSK